RVQSAFMREIRTGLGLSQADSGGSGVTVETFRIWDSAWHATCGFVSRLLNRAGLEAINVRPGILYAIDGVTRLAGCAEPLCRRGDCGGVYAVVRHRGVQIVGSV